jgi:prepilin-type processing-associated H-X9-DG protein
MAIISLLMGLLLGAVHRAREAAVSVQCKHRLKEMGLSMHLYHDANKQFPPHQITNPDNSRVRWFQQFFKDIYKVQEPMKDPAVPDWTVSRNAAYGYNYKYLGSRRTNTTSPTAPYERFPVTFWKIESPTMTIAFGCSDGTGTEGPYEAMTMDQPSSSLTGAERRPRIGNHGYTLDPTYIPSWSTGQTEPWADGTHASYLSTRHMGRPNICFVDGHVDTVDLTVIYRDNSFWNGYGQPDSRDSIDPNGPANPRYRP